MCPYCTPKSQEHLTYRQFNDELKYGCSVTIGKDAMQVNFYWLDPETQEECCDGRKIYITNCPFCGEKLE